MKASNIVNGERVAVLHGENYFIPVDSLSDGDIKEAKLYIAGHSETGHHHVLESKSNIKIVESDDRTILLDEVGKLFHKKSHDIHETTYLAPGAYKIIHKVEYNPFTKAMERVFD